MTLGILAAFLVLGAPPAKVTAVCQDTPELALFIAPRQPDTKRPTRVIAAAEHDVGTAELVVEDQKGVRATGEVVRMGGPPWGVVLTLPPLAVGRYQARVVRDGQVLSCYPFDVKRSAGAATRRRVGEDPIWEVRRRWGPAAENLYALWVEHLFDAPEDAEPTWRPLHVALRDSAKNFLFDYLNLGEDGSPQALVLKPDCADFPFTLRGYFAWKLGLPFGFRQCTRGTTERAPTCTDPGSELRLSEKPTRVRAFEKFIRWRAGGAVHSSTARTALDDPDTDLYPVVLARDTLRPGTVYADPYGHVLVVQKWIPQRGDKGDGPETAGILFAVDSQPDGTVGRRRFWRGSFLFPLDGDIKGAGFKRFRPVRIRRRPADEVAVITDAADAGTPPEEVIAWQLKAFTNGQLRGGDGFPALSLEQGKLDRNGFYERMDAVINPTPMRPDVALREVLDALTEEVKRRVTAVKNAEEWFAKSRKPIPMPQGADIFQTTGGWEDYASPSRDMRLLIAMDAVRAFPARLTAHPERFRLGTETPSAARARIEALLAKDAAARTFQYARSDGSLQTLSVGDVLARAGAFEMTYNPNDCPELRWGAADGSAEVATCTRHAPPEQVRLMRQYRPWFHDRRRPVED